MKNTNYQILSLIIDKISSERDQQDFEMMRALSRAGLENSLGNTEKVKYYREQYCKARARFEVLEKIHKIFVKRVDRICKELQITIWDFYETYPACYQQWWDQKHNC